MTTTTWTTADLAAGWTTKQLQVDAEGELGKVGDQRTGESRKPRREGETVTAAAHTGSDQLQTGNRPIGMANGDDDGKLVDDLQPMTPENMAIRNDYHSEKADLYDNHMSIQSIQAMCIFNIRTL